MSRHPLIDRRYAAPAGFVAILALWWIAIALLSKSPAKQTLILSPGASEASVEPPGSKPKLSSKELPPPEPLLRRSPQRFFASPALHEAPSKSITTPMVKNSAAASAAVRPSEEARSKIETYGAFPSVGGSDEAMLADQGATGLAVKKRAHSTPKIADREDGNLPELNDSQLTAVATIAAKANDLKAHSDVAEMRDQSSLKATLMRQFALDNKVNGEIRKAFADIESSGQPLTPEAAAKAAENALKNNDVDPEEMDLETSIARASGPPPLNSPPGAYAAVIEAILSVPPHTPATQMEIKLLTSNPPPLREPSLRRPLDMYRKHRPIFDKALEDFGVAPEIILSILKTETDSGSNMGKFLLAPTLKKRSAEVDPDGRFTKAARQSQRDIIALARLAVEGNLGGRPPDQVRGSYAGAIGCSQFLTSSWAAYSRAPDGGKRDPFNCGTGAYSTAYFLKAHGYNKDVAGAILKYNHSTEYKDTILKLSGKLKSLLNTEQTALEPTNK